MSDSTLPGGGADRTSGHTRPAAGADRMSGQSQLAAGADRPAAPHLGTGVEAAQRHGSASSTGWGNEAGAMLVVPPGTIPARAEQLETTGLPTIEEEEQDEADDRWQTTEDINELINLRGRAKSSHTRVRTKINKTIDSSICSSAQLKMLRNELVRTFETVERRHMRLVDEFPFLIDLQRHQDWLRSVETDHRAALESLVQAGADSPPPSVTGTHHSTRSTRSTASKLRDAAIEEQAALLKLQQQEVEDQLKAEEDAAINKIKSLQEHRRGASSDPDPTF